MPEESKFTAADFRVRLFLSVDLSGSTAFKNSDDGQSRKRASPKWVTTFEKFYRDFPAHFRTAYAGLKTSQTGADTCPVLWKAVGDELVFCGRVNNCKSVVVALMAFIQTLHEYRRELLSDSVSLNLKGAGWLASFPEPNRAVQLRETVDNPGYLTASEALEAAADRRPYEYDFLGKAIDTGFRVANLARPERFALSVQLARLLSGCPHGSGFDYPIMFDQPVALKGVNGDEPYPVLYIDTMKHLAEEKIRVKERELLKRHQMPSKEDLNSYLVEYCAVVGTEEITLPFLGNDGIVEPPKSYLEHKVRISEHLAAEKGRELDFGAEEEPESEDGGEIPTGGGLRPL